MKFFASILFLSLATFGSSSLLEMSQTLWTRFLEGGLTNVGKLDPLRIPEIKVDQSEGNTSYRIVLKNVEITGLNDSMLESVQVIRGRLKSNLSDHEAGYVSYSDLRNMDSVRYRFHTLVKEQKMANDSSGKSSNSHERVVEFNPKRVMAKDEQEKMGNRSMYTEQQRIQDQKMTLTGVHVPVSTATCVFINCISS